MDLPISLHSKMHNVIKILLILDLPKVEPLPQSSDARILVAVK